MVFILRRWVGATQRAVAQDGVNHPIPVNIFKNDQSLGSQAAVKGPRDSLFINACGKGDLDHY